MTKKVEPVTAWAAVDPRGDLWLTTIAHSRNQAKIAAGETQHIGDPLGLGWKAAVERGWTIRQVEIRVKEEG